MPPSVNKMYYSGRKQNRAWYPTKEFKLFKSEMADFYLMNKRQIDKTAEVFGLLIGGDSVVDIQRFYYLHRGRIFCKDGRPKRWDVTNRVKALDDALCEILGMDDSIIWKSTEEKILAPESVREHVSVLLTPMQARDHKTLATEKLKALMR